MTGLLPVAVHSPRDQRERLAATRTRVTAARDRRAQAQRSFNEAREAGDRDAQRIAAAELDQAHGELETAKELETRALSALAGVGDNVGSTLRYSLEAQDTLRQIAASTSPLREFIHVGDYATPDELGQMFGRALAAVVTVPAVADLPSHDIGLQPTPQPALTLLDLFASTQLRERTASYMRRQGGIAGAEVQTPGEVKASAAITYTAEDEPVVTVAVWSKLNRQDLDDVDALGADVQQTLSYGVRHKVEELLVAAVTGATGIASPDVAAADNAIDAAVIAVSQLRAAGVSPNFLCMHPLDVADLAQLKDGTDGPYTFGSPLAPGGALDGVTPVQSIALSQGDVLAGDSRIGAKLGIRSGLSVSVGEESDDRVRNRITVLSECRIAPLVLVPAAFSSFTITGP